MTSVPPAHPCPACGQPLRRSRRTRLERQAQHHRRWRCAQSGCGWAGLLPQPEPASPAPLLTATRHRPGTRHFSGQGLLLGVAALSAAAATAWWLRSPPPEVVMVGSHVVHRGTHLEGERLPEAHPLQTLLPAQALETEPAGYTEAEGAALRVRRHCAWGLPGRNPYRGSPMQALQTATLSPTVVKKIAADIQAGRRVDRVQISNAVIRAEGSGREFDPQHVAMTYGMTMCVDTRINFANAAHREAGDLYEAMDDDGRIYAVMVPDVCGNVSVLGQRYVREAVPVAPSAISAAEPETTRPWMRLPPEQRIRQLPDALRYADAEDPQRRRLNAQGQVISEPGSLALGALALGALWWATARRRIRAAPQQPPPPG